MEQQTWKAWMQQNVNQFNQTIHQSITPPSPSSSNINTNTNLNLKSSETITPQSPKSEEITKEKEKSSTSLTKPRSPKMDKSLAQEVVHGSARPGSGNEKIDGKEPAFHPATVPTPRKTDKDKVDETQKELLQQHFSQLFELPDEKLSEDYACALQDKLALIHGRMYISDHYVCFASTIFKQTMKKISFKDITGLYKKNTAIVFPNAIEIHTKDQRLFFMSFIFRDQAFHSLWIRWEAAKKEISQQIKSARTSVMSSRGRKKESNSEESSNDSDDSENSDSDNDSDDAKAHESDDSEDDVDQQEEDDDSDAESDEDDEASSKHSAHSTSTLGASETAGNSVATGVGLHSAAPNAAMRSSINVDTSKVKTDPEVGYRLVKRRSNSWSNDLIKKTLDESAKATDNGNNNNNEASNTTTPESNEHFTTLPVIEIPCKHVGADEAGTDYYINEFYPVSVAQFFHTLLSDKSEFWVSVNIIHDYTETVCSTWALDEAKCCYVRNMAFTSPVNAVIGPKSTRVTATQRIRFANPDHFSFDHLSMSKDVPYGDTFYIVTRFEVTKKGHGCLLQVATTVKFTKTVWGMKGMIERLSTDSSRNFNQKFATMAKEKFPAPATPPVLEKPKAHKPKAIKPIKTKKKKPAVQPEAKPATPQSLIAAITELTSSPLVSDIVRAIYLLMLFILFVLVFSQYSTIAHLSDQVSLSMTAASKAENKILFLQHFVETVVRNVTGAEGTLKEQWVLWQSHKELLNKLDGYKIQMDLLKSEIERTQHMLGDLELEGLNADKVFEDATPTSVFAFLFKMSVLAAIAYAVYWAILNKDVILQTVSPPKKPNPPHTKTE